MYITTDTKVLLFLIEAPKDSIFIGAALFLFVNDYQIFGIFILS